MGKPQRERQTLGDHMAIDHGTPRDLITAVSLSGLRFLHEGAHTLPNGKPDDAPPEHIAGE